MVAQRVPAPAKPSRSDELLDPHHQLLITAQVRARLDSLAPKRPAKPSRSEPDSGSAPAPPHAGAIPELERLRSLRLQAQPVIDDEGGLMEEEFVETNYYQGLIAIDKQHHTTGTGFIRVDYQSGPVHGSPRTADNGGEERNGVGLGLAFRGNPAMNDWTPSFEAHDQVYVSSKPTRSG